MKNFRKDNGITLIALVVTIVVLLILAGITIATLFGENGIINAARKAAGETSNSENTTEQGLQGLENDMNKKLGNTVIIPLDKLIKENEENPFVTAEQGNQIVKDKTNKTMVVPVGFKIADDSSSEIDKGVVIEDKLQNQYVWVPVSGSFSDPNSELSAMFGSNDNGANYFGKLYEFTNTDKGDPVNGPIGSIGYVRREPDIVTSYDGSDATSDASYFKDAIDENMTGSAFQAKLQKDFNEMVKSVEHYHGFYIGRYEASSLNSANPKTVKWANPKTDNMASIDWYNMYKNMQGIETNASVDGNVKTNMIWGCQWDRTLDWIANTDTNIGYAGINNSTSWGNYSDATFEYKATKDATTTTTKANKSYTSTMIPTGSTEYTKANNIYDLAGNLAEWTMEAYNTNSRHLRGGYFDVSGSNYASWFTHTGPPYTGNTPFGSRPTLYVIAP